MSCRHRSKTGAWPDQWLPAKFHRPVRYPAYPWRGAAEKVMESVALSAKKKVRVADRASVKFHR